MQRLPRVTSWSSGEVTLTIASSWTCSVRLQPTPQYGHTVSTSDFSSCFHSPACRNSYSCVGINAPVGQTAMQFPQYTHADSGNGKGGSVGMFESKPRPATALAKVVWYCSEDAWTLLSQRMNFE